jgi:hypothetical protein
MIDLIQSISAREPDFYIGGWENTYIKRWWLTPRAPEETKAYLHNQLRDDEDRAHHDHPSDNISIIIEGGYIEHTPGGVYYRAAGQVISRKAADLHRLALYRDANGVIIPSWSIFIMGPKIREWGFQCGDRWVPWQQFCDETDHGKVGRGCE